MTDFPAKSGRKNCFPDLLKGKHKHTVRRAQKKECALAHSRAEARLPRQPSTLAPSAHPRGAFLSYGNEVSYMIKKNPAKQDSPPAAGRASDILPFRCSAIRAEHFLSYGNEVSYTIRKQADAHFKEHPPALFLHS